MNGLTKTDIFFSVFVQKRSSVNGALEFGFYIPLLLFCSIVVLLL